MKKQETLEEASEYYAHNYFDMHETNNYQALKQGFIEGAKWQQEQWEEDLKEAFSMGRLGKTDMSFKEWFEQFKNK